LSLTEASSGGEELTNPYLGQPEAIAAGRDLYGSKCYVCHHKAGARGPNLFATKLTDEQFLETVINGRRATQMPAFGLRLSPDEVWQLHAFVKSTDHY
jgi:mono/diheme cytochrome c family protein